MSWGLAWKRPSDSFRIALRYGEHLSDDAAAAAADDWSPPGSLRIDLDWTAGDDEDQVALRLQSQLMVALPPPHDAVALELAPRDRDGGAVGVEMRVVRRREPLRAVTMSKTAGSGQQTDGVGVLARLLRSKLDGSGCGDASDEHWISTTTFGMQGLGLSTLPVEITRLSMLEKLFLDNNKLTVLPPELGQLKNLKVLTADNNMLASVPVELRQCVRLVELSLEHNKLVRPLLDFRAMAELRTLRLFGNPLEFLPEILPLQNLRHLSLANIRIEADENLKSVNVKIETEVSSYFVASRHKLSAFFSLIFRFSSCHHPLLASALAKIVQDGGNRAVISKDENAVRQLISMISSENRHVVEQACSALSSLAADRSLVMQLIKCDIMQPIQSLLKSMDPDELISALEVVVNLAFASDIVAQKMLTRDVLKSLKTLCAHKSVQVQKLALFAVGNLAFCLENRRTLATSDSLNELLLRLTTAREPCVKGAAARALAILGENENLRRAIKGRQVGKRGLRILSMDGGGMKGMTTVQILKEIEQGTGKRIHEMFDLICGTSTGGMLAIAIGIKQMTLEQCEDIYKKLGKVVFTERTPKDNEAATWMEKLDQLYKSSSQNIRVVVHGSKHSAEPFERLLKEMCTDEEGDLLIESAVKNIPKVFVVSTLVSVMPAQPFLFRNYQYPAGTLEVPFGGEPESPITGGRSMSVCKQQGAYMGSCKHHVWEAIRASSAAPYYLDDFSDDANRWQDGAILANNPTIVAIREAQVLWPDTSIDCVVSVGCGSVPTKVRKGGWRHIDTWQVLIESACSVERVEEIINTFIPMIPEINYFRFNPVDERCDMELDETDPAVWPKLEAATQEYILNHAEEFKRAFQLLAPPLDEDKLSDKPNAHLSAEVENSPSLGRRRMVLLLEASSSPDFGKETHHARSLESFCTRKGIRLSLMNNIPELPKPAAMFRTPFTSPLFSGSFPSSPLIYSPEAGVHKMNRIDLVPPLNLDGLQGVKVSSSPPSSPPGIRLFSVPARSLHEKLQNLTHVGIVHLALQNDSVGAILSWRNDVFVIAEPGDAAERFLQSVKLSLSQGCGRKDVVSLAKVVTVADLVAWQPCFQAGGVLHRYIGRQTHVLEDGQEISAFLFRQTVPAIHLTPDDVRWMIGAWRDRIIICTGKCGPCPSLLKAFLDNGAKAVIASSVEPPEAHPGFFGSGDLNGVENGRFEIGDEEADIEEQEPTSPMSDWEESEPDESSFWKDEEEDLSHFVCQLYDGIFRGLKVNVALQQALAPHPKLKYICHLPNIPNL